MNLWEAIQKRTQARCKHTRVSPGSLLTVLILVKKLTKSYRKSSQKRYLKRVFNGGDQQTQEGIPKNEKMEPRGSLRRLHNGVKIGMKTAFRSFWATYSLQTVPKTLKDVPKGSQNVHRGRRCRRRPQGHGQIRPPQTLPKAIIFAMRPEVWKKPQNIPKTVLQRT